MNPGPLHALQVVDLTRLLPGPMCSWYLRGTGGVTHNVRGRADGRAGRDVQAAGSLLRLLLAVDALHGLARDARHATVATTRPIIVV